VVGHDLNQAFRLLNSDDLRAALKATEAQSVLCVSDGVYQGIVRHGHHGVPAEEFGPITVHGKEGPLQAWLHGAPGRPPAPAAEPTAHSTPRAEPEPPVHGGGIHFLGGSPSFGGSLISGDQHIVSGGVVHGDVNIGNSGIGNIRPDRAR
jgi:hypothetical protein